MRAVLGILILFTLAGCDKYFGKKTDLDFIEVPEFQPREIAYVPIQPVWDGFVEPVDIIAGFDELFYVVDKAREEIISMDEAGRILGRLKIQGVTSVSQDRRFNLLAVGKSYDTIAGTPYELTCIYRIVMPGTNYSLNQAKVTKKIVHPFYFKSTFSASDASVKFYKIAVLADNSYYVTRQGNDNNANKFGGPDDAILLFSAGDSLLTPVTVTTSGGGFYNNYFKAPAAIASFVQPPQVSASGGKEFFYTSNWSGAVIKAQVIDYIESEFGASYMPRAMDGEDPGKADGFLITPGKFTQPSGVAIAGDQNRYLFVVDAMKDSLYQFTSTGLEGIKPPPGSAETKYQMASFGGRGKALNQFNRPMAVAYRNEMVYVADAGNGRILRFRLTTDFD